MCQILTCVHKQTPRFAILVEKKNKTPKMAKKKNVKKKKLEIVFDPQKRKEFLTGFTKRKNERRKRARDEMEKSVKAERKRIRQEVKEGMKHLKKTFEPLRELTEEDKAEDGGFRRKEKEYEDDDVKVKIVELTTAQLAKQRNLLGENKDETTDEENDKDDDDDDEEDVIRNVNLIPGMDFDVDSVKKRKNKKQDESKKKTDDKNDTKPKVKKIRGLQNIDLKSKKDLDHFTKKKVQNKLNQSKAFRLKERFQQRANKKQSKRERYNTMKSLPKTQQKKLKAEASRNRKSRMGNKKP